MSALSSELFTGKTVMCFVGTPFQFLALLCIFSDEGSCCYENLDLYVYPQFEGVYETCNRFCETVRVRNCFVNENFETYPKVRKLALVKCLESIVRSNRGKARFVKAFPQAGVRHYDVVMCPSVNDHTITAKQICAQEGYTVFYDDGVGSHNGNVFKSNFCLDKVLLEDRRLFSKKEWQRNRLKALARVVGGSYVQHNIRALCLFNPCAFEFKLYPATDIEPIKIPDDISIVQRCISSEYNGDTYKDVRFIFLSFPHDVSKEALAIERSMIRLLSELLDGFVVRPHPRRNPDDFNSLGVCVVESSDSWEILLMQRSINENMTLIGFGSSAQVHPKTLFDLEPRLVFMHRLLSGKTHASMSVEWMVDDMKERYRNEDRVIVLESMEQCAEMAQAWVC